MIWSKKLQITGLYYAHTRKAGMTPPSAARATSRGRRSRPRRMAPGRPQGAEAHTGLL